MEYNFMVGTISHLPEDMDRIKERAEIHAEQLRWLEGIGIDFDYYRVEGAWGNTAKSSCNTTLNLHSIETGKNPPGFNRNLLLKVLYESDYDWLVCLDDDRRFYPMFNADAIFQDLSTPAFKELAKKGYMMLSLDPMVMPFKKVNYSWEHHETHWYLTKGNPNGFLQICFIPNLVKYGYKPIYFNGETACLQGDAPEDVQFQIDWLIGRHPIILNHNLIMDEINQSNGSKSIIYKDNDFRKKCHESHGDWEKSYLKSKFPRNPALWSKSELNKRKNPVFNTLVPRGVKYVFHDRDLPKEC